MICSTVVQNSQNCKIFAYSKAVKLATKSFSSDLWLCFPRETVIHWFPKLLHLIIPVVLSDLSALSPLFARLSQPNHIFVPKRAAGIVNTDFCRLSQCSRLLLLHFLQSYVRPTEHSCSKQRKHQKTRKTLFLQKNLFSSLKSVP